MAAYFHQDWDIEARSANEIVGQYLAESESIARAGVIDDLHQLLSRGLTENELSSTLLELSCYYDPTPDGFSYAEWLHIVKELLSQHLVRSD